jgi:hypothetical protein
MSSFFPAEPPGHPNLVESLARIDAADVAFFQRFPKRRHRVRVAGRAEVEHQHLRKCPQGTRWFAVVRRSNKRGRKFRLTFVFVAADPRLDTDVPESVAAGAYARATGLTVL